MKQSEEAIATRQKEHKRGADDAITTPLRKRRLSGALYERDPKTNALISELAAPPRDKLPGRAAPWSRAKFLRQFRLFFRYQQSADVKIVVLAWVDDEPSRNGAL